MNVGSTQAEKAKSIQRILHYQDENLKTLLCISRRLTIIRTSLLGMEEFDQQGVEGKTEKPKPESFLDRAIDLNQDIKNCLEFLNTQLHILENACEIPMLKSPRAEEDDFPRKNR